ncbi:PREDICTED: uncharacterized protein LOC109469387 [Branchiostoma belcheri]|uniref:Uncharacterized protein LOC109469387 n=1 Tax=Branchiostoma belcheri TaxID=7741 RepID=A0A6P4YXD8_BRABE|nr:PREDICTED: uncharacterized protein LOC109469387 [Branchiostoma belcheri]
MMKVSTVILVLLSVAEASFTQEGSCTSSLDANKAMKLTTKGDLWDMNSVMLDGRSVDSAVHGIVLPTLFGSFMTRDKGNESLSSFRRGTEIQTGRSFPTLKSRASSTTCSYKQSDGYRTAALLATRMQTAGQRLTRQRQHSGGMPYPSNSVVTFDRRIPSLSQKIVILYALLLKVAFLLTCCTSAFLILMLHVQLLVRSKYIENVWNHCVERLVLHFLITSLFILVLNGLFFAIGFAAWFVFEITALIFQHKHSKHGVYKCIFDYPINVLWVLLRELKKTQHVQYPPYVQSSTHTRNRRNG